MKRAVSILLAFCICISFIHAPERVIYAQTELQKAKDKKAELEKKHSESKTKLENYKKTLSSAKSEQERLAAEEAIEKAEREMLTAELLGLYAEGEAILAALEDAQKEYLEAEERFYENARLMYIYSRQSPIEILAGSESISDFFKRVKMIIFVSEEDNKLIEDMESSKQEYEYKKQLQEEASDLINEMITNKDLSLDNINLSKGELENKISNAQKLLSDYEAEEHNLKDDLKVVEAEIMKLEEVERKRIEEERKKIEAEKKKQEEEKKKAEQNKKNNNNNNNNNSAKYTGGIMRWPVPYTTKISSNYGTRKDPITGKSAVHSGIDVPAPRGSSIVAAADGTVIMATTNGGYGKCVQIDHGGGIVTLYAHCNEILVSVGQKIKKGDLIARVGTTGRSTGNHLHFEVRMNGSPVNPMPYFNG